MATVVTCGGGLEVRGAEGDERHIHAGRPGLVSKATRAGLTAMAEET